MLSLPAVYLQPSTGEPTPLRLRESLGPSSSGPGLRGLRGLLGLQPRSAAAQGAPQARAVPLLSRAS